MSDPFAELFRLLRVRSAVYFAQDFASPWGMALPRRPYVQFHVALAGECRVEWSDGALTLSAREVVLFPNGAAHTLSDGNGGPPRDGREIVQAIRRGETPFPGTPPDVRLLSGHFEFDRAAKHPLLRDLPDTVHVSAPEGFDAPLYRALEPLISEEAASRQPGAETIVERLRGNFPRAGPAGPFRRSKRAAGATWRPVRRAAWGRGGRDPFSLGRAAHAGGDRQGGRHVALRLRRHLRYDNGRHTDGLSCRMAIAERPRTAGRPCPVDSADRRRLRSQIDRGL